MDALGDRTEVNIRGRGRRRKQSRYDDLTPALNDYNLGNSPGHLSPPEGMLWQES